MFDKKVAILESVAAPFLGCHAVRANNYCFCPVVVPPFGSERLGGKPGDDMLAQFPRGAAAVEAVQVLDLAEQSLKAVESSLAQGT